MLNLTTMHEFYPIEMLFGIWTWVPKEPCIRWEPKAPNPTTNGALLKSYLAMARLTRSDYPQPFDD